MLDEYEKYIVKPENFIKTLFNVLFSMIFLLVLYHEKLDKWIGLELTILLSFVISIVLVYVNRRKFGTTFLS